MPEEPPGVWEGVRRALGRLIGSARVRDLPLERLGVCAVAVSGGELAGPPCPPGARERAWRPAALVAENRLPTASAGAGGADLAAVATVIGMDAALRPEALEMFDAPPLSAACTTHRLEAGGALGATATVRGSAVAFPPGDVRRADARVAAPAARRLPVDSPAAPRPKHGARFGRRPPPADAWRLAEVRVRSGLDRIAEVPLTRARSPLPTGLGAVGESTSQRLLLAEASGVPPDDVVLLGVFSQVPVAAVRRLALEDGGGALSLWLKPEALAHAAAGRSPRLATLVLGRQRSTGRMLQAVI